MKYVKRFTSFAIVLTLTISAISTLKPPGVSALSGNEFQSGRIIDDGVFFNGSTMDIPTIQTFLNSKVPTCDTYGRQASSHSGYATRADWGAQNGYPAPYICLKDYGIDSFGYLSDQYCSAIGYGHYSVAGMIYSVGKACNISPKVLLVLLQKEQSLVTDDWPWPSQYSAATGYACPDTASCDPAYSGLFSQLFYGARQYKIYAQQPQLFNFSRDVTRAVGYNPNSACGSSNIYIQNQATAGLYNYTPYQPNKSALDHLYGTGDGCSAYGNRNFWRMYNDWFGNTFGIPFSASFYRESALSTSVAVRQQGSMWFDYQNTGSQFWKDDASALPYYPRTRLVSSWPLNRYNAFYDPATWLSPSRPTGVFAKVFEGDGITLASDQHTVWPGQIGRFQFNLVYPQNGIPGGSYRENFELVQDGAPNWWVTGSGAWQAVDVPDNFKATFAGVSPAATVSPGHNGTLSFKYMNTGSQFWKDDASALPYYPRTRLVSSWPLNRYNAFYDPATWLNPSRPVSVFSKVYENDGTTLAVDQHTVWPGQIALFQFNVSYPTNGIAPGTYRENFELVQDGQTNWWVTGSGAWQNVTASSN